MMPALPPEGTASENASRFLAEASHALAKSFDLSTTLPLVAQLATSYLADCCVIQLDTADGQAPIVAAASRQPGVADAVRSRVGPIGGNPQLRVSVAELPLAWWHEIGLEPAGVENILVGESCVGVLVLAHVRPPADGGPVDPELVRELSQRLATAIDNAHRFMRERRVARSFQTALLPVAFPKYAGRTFHASYAPATDEAEVGGDWYDAFDLPDGRIAMSIGDVAGHGLEAAVIMGEVRQTFRVAAMENRDPAAVLDMANRLLLLRPHSTMVTAIFGMFDGRRFTYSSAGHPPPILGTIEGGVEKLPISGIPLGVDAQLGRTAWTVTIPSGSVLVLYTDGLIESDHDVIDGERALIAAVKAEMQSPSADPARSIRDRVLGPRRNLDDIAILTLTVQEAPTPELDLQYTAVPVAARLVRQSVTRFARETALTEEQNFALNVAIGEAVNNVIEHAYLRTPGTVAVRLWREDRKLMCAVEDQGSWRRARKEGRGHGLPIIRSLMDGVEVNLSQGGTVIKMVYNMDGRGEKDDSATGSR
jgi:anti-sigma regulatory factor (Ser/Thr protein kinase)